MKLCLAAWEHAKIRIESVIEEKYPYLLSSFLYIHKVSQYLPKIFQFKKLFILDSGAHTLQKEGKEVDYDKLVFEYAEFVKNHKEIDEYVELDIENKVGLRQVEKWREYLTKKVGKSPIVVWHRERGKKYWLYMVKRYPYVGFSGFVVTPDGEKEVPDKYIGWFIKTAHDYNTKVHGFGFTRVKLLKKFPFDSVDSSSWVLSVGYGRLPYFDSNTGELRFINAGAKNGYKVKIDRYRYSLKEWKKYAQYLENFWKAKRGGFR